MSQHSDYKACLEKILRVCYESSEYSRRTQVIHNEVMIALGFTANQRKERHDKALMRSEAYKESKQHLGMSAAKKLFISGIEVELGERRMRIPKTMEQAQRLFAREEMNKEGLEC